MPKRIERIKLERFRGATGSSVIDIDTSKPIVLLFGENGTGKSSVVDAVSCAIHGDCGSLETISVGSNRVRHLPSLGYAHTATAISISIDGQEWTASCSTSEVTTNAPAPHPPILILRRRDLLKLIEAQPADRYQAFAPFLGIDSIASAESELERTVSELENSARSARDRLTGAERVIQESWEAIGGPATGFSSAYDWVLGITQADVDVAQQQADDARSLLTHLTSATTLLQELYDLQQQAAAAQARLDELQKSRPAGVDGLSPEVCAALVPILQPAHSFILAHADRQDCPVCEQPIRPAELAPKLDERLKRFGSFVEHAKKIVTASEDHRNAKAVLNAKQGELHSKFRELRQVVTTSEWLANTIPQDLHTPKDDCELAEAKQFIERLTAHRSFVENLHGKASTSATALAQALELAPSLSKMREETAWAEAVRARAKAIKSVVEEERKSHVQSVLEAMQTEIQNIYSHVHPGEAVYLSSLYLNPIRARSLEFKVDFHGHDVNPPAILSESHLDTLGIAIFLATAKATGSETIVILDDVFMSVDNAHLNRMIDLLVDLSSSCAQIIITTHMRRLSSRFSQHEGATNLTHRIQLLPWRFDAGIRTAGSPTEGERLREMLAQEPLDRQAVAGKSGILAEAMFDHLVLQYRCPCPKTPDGENTLHELSSAFRRTGTQMVVRRGEIANNEWNQMGSDLPVDPAMRTFLDHQFVRNEVGAHWNQVGQDHSDAEVRGFADATLALLDILVCPSCGSLPCRKSNDFRTCQCRATRYTPLERAS